MKKVFIFILLFFVFAAVVQPVLAQRYATCDKCGYCTSGKARAEAVPEGWAECAQCLYPQATIANKQSLLIDLTTNLPLQPQKGHYWTMLGCIKTDAGDFTKEGAIASLVQPLLNLVFSAAGVIAFMYILYGAAVVMTSQANPERLNYGKRLMIGALVGLVFVLASVFIVNLVGNQILGIPDIGSADP